MNDRAVIGGTDHAVIGHSPRRREDARFVTGDDAYPDDLCAVGVTSLNKPAWGFRVWHAIRDDRL